ncbi:MAG: sensor histidine kinase [Bacillus sp. (in: firmicutes)]
MLGYLRLVVFFLLWIIFFIEQSAGAMLVGYILGCAISIVFFYLIKPVRYSALIRYGQIILLCMLLVISGSGIVVFIILYIHIESSYSLSAKKFHLQSGILLAILFGCLQVCSLATVEWLLGIGFIVAVSFFYKLMQEQLLEKTQLYEGLLREYRILKRQAYHNQKAARLEERTHIAREIHDAVGHKLTSLLMLLKMNSMEAADDSERFVQLAEEALHETRKAVRTLENDEYEGIGSVLQLIRKLESESHIFIAFTTEKGVLSSNLSNRQSVCLYRILQETLTNAMKHAYSREVQVKLSKNAIGRIELIVANKVLGPKAFEYGFGLQNMEKRIQELGGELLAYYEGGQFVVKGSFPEERSG